jgi:hypothetical protein
MESQISSGELLRTLPSRQIGLKLWDPLKNARRSPRMRVHLSFSLFARSGLRLATPPRAARLFSPISAAQSSSPSRVDAPSRYQFRRRLRIAPQLSQSRYSRRRSSASRPDAVSTAWAAAYLPTAGVSTAPPAGRTSTTIHPAFRRSTLPEMKGKRAKKYERVQSQRDTTNPESQDSNAFQTECSC